MEERERARRGKEGRPGEGGQGAAVHAVLRGHGGDVGGAGEEPVVVEYAADVFLRELLGGRGGVNSGRWRGEEGV